VPEPAALDGDEMAAALVGLVGATEANDRVNERIRARAAMLLERRGQGEAWADIIRSEEGPLIVELLRENLDRHLDAGGRLRRAEARALHAEGMTMDQIAALFGVTRQRVSQLLRA